MFDYIWPLALMLVGGGVESRQTSEGGVLGTLVASSPTPIEIRKTCLHGVIDVCGMSTVVQAEDGRVGALRTCFDTKEPELCKHSCPTKQKRQECDETLTSLCSVRTRECIQNNVQTLNSKGCYVAEKSSEQVGLNPWWLKHHRTDINSAIESNGSSSLKLNRDTGSSGDVAESSGDTGLSSSASDESAAVASSSLFVGDEFRLWPWFHI
mmetsp:Transcript_10559/g.19276  ORF Transcript_10559/g.19276 Transcript_10559/m.19276 type:complete len:210 (-) Transcript_10559:85-714(-)